MKAIMISGRTLAQGACCEAKLCQDFYNAASICFISGADLAALGTAEGRNVLIRSQHGQAVFSPREDKDLPSGMIFIAMGPWANALVGPDTGGCGTPQYKGVEVDVEPTDKPVLDVRTLISDIRRAKA